MFQRDMTKGDFSTWHTGCDVSGHLSAVNSLSIMQFAAITRDTIYAWRFRAQVVFDGTEKPRNLTV
jgi:hypothetical protein